MDGQENSYATIESAKINEVQKYLAPTRHVYASQLILFGKKFWDRLSADEQKILQESAQEAIQAQRLAARSLEAKARETLQKKGLKFSEITPQEMARLKERVKPVIEKHTASLPSDLKTEFFAEVEKARSTK